MPSSTHHLQAQTPSADVRLSYLCLFILAIFFWLGALHTESFLSSSYNIKRDFTFFMGFVSVAFLAFNSRPRFVWP
jgi:hypothetical protein